MEMRGKSDEEVRSVFPWQTDVWEERKTAETNEDEHN